MRKTKSRQPLVSEGKALRRYRGPRSQTFEVMHPRPDWIEHSSNRPTYLALRSFGRQRLSDIRRGWCPAGPKVELRAFQVFRSDVNEAHRLS